MKKGWGTLIVFCMMTMATKGHAVCSGADSYKDILSSEQVVMMYDICATFSNDDDSQVIMARNYAKGLNGVPKDLNRALYYYQLSAENGNAESQAQLAKLYIELDRTPATRVLLKKYLKTVNPVNREELGRRRYPEEEFHGELMHPYALLLLANERPENKWFYPSSIREAPKYVGELLKSYNLSDEKKQKQKQAAVAWKKRKLLEAAIYTLSEEEYKTFKKTLYPTDGKADPVARDKALQEFKQRYEATKGKQNA